MDHAGSQQRRYGFACIQCRNRKVKCGGEKPSCRKCVKSELPCSYKSSDAQISHLKAELSRCQSRLRELERGIESLTLAAVEDRERKVQDLIDMVNNPTGPSAQAELEGTEADNTDDPGDQCADEEESRARQAEISIDEDGSLSYFGATSRFHSRPQPRPVDEAQQAVDRAFHAKWLQSNARFQKSWEDMAYLKLQEDPEVDAHISSTLLRIYWTWQAPLHNCVYRQCFFRDVVMGGPYFSSFLLNVIYAHASRHIPDDDPIHAQVGQGEDFLRKAKHLLLLELEADTPRVPTIQGLLILGGRQCAIGRHSEGWLYTGMAIRMIKDLGLHLNGGKAHLSKDLEPDDLEARKRLFLSAYAWDKSISLCLGRPPSLTEMPYSPNSLLDNSGDADDWIPFYLKDRAVSYPPTQSLTSLTFTKFCELSMLVNECYNTIYSGKTTGLKVKLISDLENKLRAFYERLPAALCIGNAEDLVACPPPHICSLHILYHTLMILIYRPFLSGRIPQSLSRRARQVCLENATGVNAFFRLYGRTFSFRNQTYLTSYCVYTAATVELLELDRSPGENSIAIAERLSTIMQMLETEARQTPGIRRSIDIIAARLKVKVPSHGRTELANSISSQQVNQSHDAVTSPSVEGLSSMSVSNCSTVGQQMEYFAEGSTLPPHQEYVYGGHSTSIGFQPGLDYSGTLSMDDQYFGPWFTYDASGGFNPTMASWTLYDTVGHPESC